MKNRLSLHARAVLQALFVTVLWSSSWILIKTGLGSIPALTFAGLRYSLACLCLLPLALRPELRRQMKELTRREWAGLALLGLVYYTITQGAQFVSLALLPAVTANLLLNFTPALVAILGIFTLSERPTARQWAGMGLSLVGVFVYFYQAAPLRGQPVRLPAAQVLGLAVALVGVAANAVSAILGRRINRSGQASPVLVTTFSMGIGAALLLAAGLALQGPPRFAPGQALPAWLTIAWLAGVNTALAFTLWNASLQRLQAMESSLINNTMLVQIAILAWIFLGETLSAREIAGLALVGIGTLIVQLRPPGVTGAR